MKNADYQRTHDAQRGAKDGGRSVQDGDYDPETFLSVLHSCPTARTRDGYVADLKR